MKTQEILENNPVDNLHVGKINGSLATMAALESVAIKRKFEDDGFDEENLDNVNGHDEKKVTDSGF